MAKKTVYRDSAFGTAVYPHLNTPDGKFNPDNPLFKVSLRVPLEEAQPMMDIIKADAEAAFEEVTADMTPKDKKAYSLYLPYELEEDDEGNATGYVLFFFKQNSVIKLKDGTTKTIKIGIYDAAGKPMTKIVFGGSDIRVNYSTRLIKVAGKKEAGVRLDFGRVQVRKLGEGSGGGGGFGSVDGYRADEDDEGEDNYGSGSKSQGEVGDGDY